MVNKKMYLLLFLIIGLASCEKEAGDGGLATIEGNVYYDLYGPSGSLIEQVPAGNENVYIKYADSDTYDDRTDTDADGKFQFKSMQKGEYAIFGFSDCISCTSGIDEVAVTLEVTDKKGTASADNLVLRKDQDHNDGSSKIQGRVFRTTYDSQGIEVSADYEPDVNVYIVYGTEVGYFDKVQTDGAGEYESTSLLKGAYKIFAYSDYDQITTITVEVSTDVTSNGQTISVNNLAIEKR